jgi:hypothetical protein
MNISNDLASFLFGVNSSSLAVYNSLGLMSDSFWLNVWTIGGLVAIIVSLLCIFLSYINLKNFNMISNDSLCIKKSIFISLILLACLGFIGNVQSIFPHGIFFWVFMGLLVPCKI